MARVSFQPLQEAADPFEESEADEEKAMEDDLQFPDVILALHSVKKSTGAACYCAADNSIQLFEDTQDASGDLAALSLSVGAPLSCAYTDGRSCSC